MKQNTSPPRVGILLDIETSKNIGTFYGKTYETNIIDVIEYSHLTSFSVKIVGQEKIYTYDLQDFPLYKRSPKSDKALLIKLSEWHNKADYTGAHNGDKFDIPAINARLAYWGLPILQPKKTVDTLKEARKIWKLPSNKLTEIAKFFKWGEKTKRGNRREERIYVANDVYLLDKLFTKLLPYLGNHPAFKVVKEKVVSFDKSCPYCKSTHTQSRGLRVANGVIRGQYQCQSCYKWFPVILKLK